MFALCSVPLRSGGFSRAPEERHKVSKVSTDIVSNSIYMLPNTKGGNFFVVSEKINTGIEMLTKATYV